MNICDDCGEPHFYDFGDRVQLAQNHLVKGQVIGERSWGDEYQVRLIGVLQAEWYRAIELEPDDDFYGPAASAKPENGAPAAPDNVINLAAVRAAGRG